MGYVIELVGADFRIPRGQKQSALVELVDMMDEAGHEPYDKAFDWLEGIDHHHWYCLESALYGWRFRAEMNGSMDIVDLEFKGEKLGQEKEMFECLAPFVEDHSYLEFEGEDGKLWRWTFIGDRVLEQTLATGSGVR